MLGKPVLGICNGAQILVESGLVPGNKEFDTLVSLTDNKRTVAIALLEQDILTSGVYKALRKRKIGFY